ncbi:hypothetical protein, partial [Streptomyces sp. AC627_RSS907]|uniref:WXG100-like domain-containing protein n=1 Tax=Streptomyces sp. AC627_RSS907 TaxID=2823684 RepID=UPI001C2435C1
MAYIPPEYADLMFVLLGERPLEANSDLTLQFSELLHWSADRVREMKILLLEAQHHQLQDALPHEVAERFGQVLGEYTGIGGSGYLDVFTEELDRLGMQVAGLSRDIEEAHREIIAELFLLASTLASLSALGFFTGGFSFSQMALARSLARLNIMRRISSLVMLGALVEGVYQGLEEALTQLAVQLSMMIPAPFNPEGRRRTELDWKKVGEDLFIGSLMGVFTHGFDRFLKPVVDIFKDSALWKRTFVDESGNFLTTGGGESLAELVGLGILNGTWEFNLDTFLGAGLSSVVTGNIGKGLFLSFKHGSDLMGGPDNPYKNPADFHKQPSHTPVVDLNDDTVAPPPYSSAAPDLPGPLGVTPPPVPLNTLDSGTPQPGGSPGPDYTDDYTHYTGTP